MQARTKEMQEILNFLNKDWTTELNAFRKEHKEEHTVTIGNGIRKEVSLKYAVGEMADRQELMRDKLDQVYIDTTILRDANSMGDIIKRHKWKFTILFSGSGIALISTLIRIWVG